MITNDQSLNVVNDGKNAFLKTKEKINHPSHYNTGKIEVIDYIEDQNLGFNLGNCVKYISRAEHKDNAEDDLNKAFWYLRREIKCRGYKESIQTTRTDDLCNKLQLNQATPEELNNVEILRLEETIKKLKFNENFLLDLDKITTNKLIETVKENDKLKLDNLILLKENNKLKLDNLILLKENKRLNSVIYQQSEYIGELEDGLWNE